MTAIDRDAIKICVCTVNTAASSLILTGTTALGPILGEIKSYSKSGGERETETDPHFGGMVKKKQPIGQVELSFDITPSAEYADKWDLLAYGTALADTALAVMNIAPVDRTVFIQALVGTNYMSYGFNNCSITVLDMDHEAGDVMTKKMTLKFAPETDAGKTNFLGKKIIVTSLPAWGTY